MVNGWPEVAERTASELRKRARQAIYFADAGLRERLLLMAIVVMAMPRSQPRLTGLLVLGVWITGMLAAYPVRGGESGETATHG